MLDEKNVVGNLSSRQVIQTEASTGKHNITVESYVNGVGIHTNTFDRDGRSFTITDATRQVTIIIKTKGSWIGFANCVIDSIG